MVLLFNPSSTRSGLDVDEQSYFRKYEIKKNTFKDIVQPKKRGVKRGIIRFVLTSYTIADIFFDNLKG